MVSAFTFQLNFKSIKMRFENIKQIPEEINKNIDFCARYFLFLKMHCFCLCNFYHKFRLFVYNKLAHFNLEILHAYFH